jgi:hypothetical protein
MRRLFATVMICCLALPMSTIVAAASPAAQSTGSLAGQATDAGGQNLSNAIVRLRNLADGQITATTVTNAAGEFSFGSLPAGNYVVEVLNGAGGIAGSSAAMAVAEGAAIAGVGVSVPAGTVLMAGGGSFFTSTLGLISIATAGALVTAITVPAGQSTASPAR